MPAAVDIRNIAGQGAYCDIRFSMPLTAIPGPTATSFRVEFYLTHPQATGIPELFGTPLFRDENGRCHDRPKS